METGSHWTAHTTTQSGIAAIVSVARIKVLLNQTLKPYIPPALWPREALIGDSWAFLRVILYAPFFMARP